MTEYTKPTDEVHVINLPSKITHAIWRTKAACVEEKAVFEVWTHFVGNGSDIQIKVEDKRGKKIEKLKGKVYGDYFAGSVIVSKKAKEELFFTAKLPKHGLEKKSGILKVIPSIKVTNMKWGQEVARREDVVKLNADIEGVPDETEVMIHIYEYDQDDAHDFITKFPVTVKNSKIEAEWEYQYYEDTDEIPTEEEKQEYGRHYNPPEYFFVVDMYRKRFGEKQESDLLIFRDWIQVFLTNGLEEPIPDEPFILYLPDGNTKEGQTDEDGRVREDKIPPGKVYVEFPAFFELHNVTDGQYELLENIIPPEIIETGETDDNLNKTEQNSSRDETHINDSHDVLDEEEIDDFEFDNEAFGGLIDIEEDPDYDGEDVEDEDYETSFLEFLPENELMEEYPVASRHCVTGEEFHLAVIHYLAVRIVDGSGRPIGQQVKYQIKDKHGRVIFEGSCDKQGRIEHGGVGMDVYELIVKGKSVRISSFPDISEKEIVVFEHY